MRKTLILVAATAILPVVLVACGDDTEVSAPVVKKDDGGAAAKDDAAAAEAPKQQDLSYTYNAVNRRDPFKTYFDELSQNEQQDQANLTELQKIDLDKLKLEEETQKKGP